MVRDILMEAWLKKRLTNIDMGGYHGAGWSWIGNCPAQHICGTLNPDLKEKQPIGATYPGSMGHHFFQTYVFKDGIKIGDIQVLAHEQELFIPMKYQPFRMSPADTLLFDYEMYGFGIIDYKFVKDLDWVEESAKIDNIEQVNLYGYKMNAVWFAIIYVHKQNYDDFRIHRYPVDKAMALQSIKKLEMVDSWLANDKEGINWTDLALGLTKYTIGRNSYRFICEASRKTNYAGCPYKDMCLEELNKQYGQEFTSLTRFDAYVKQHRTELMG